jgi:hypothetical protein
VFVPQLLVLQRQARVLGDYALQLLRPVLPAALRVAQVGAVYRIARTGVAPLGNELVVLNVGVAWQASPGIVFSLRAGFGVVVGLATAQRKYVRG